jgi:isoleucyl-tRNA synthetase
VLGSFEPIAEITGKDLVGISYESPFAAGAVFKIIPSPHVTIDSGTGLVHCAPAHGMEDYSAFQSLGLDQLDLLCHVDGEGKFTQDVASVTGETIAKSLVGLDILKDGSKAMVKVIEDTGALLKVQKIKHRYPYDWKTGEPVIIMYVQLGVVSESFSTPIPSATSQWFANLDNIKTRALKAIESVAFYPAICKSCNQLYK